LKRFLMFIGFTLALALFVINLKYIVPVHAEQVDVYENQKLVKSVVFKIGVPYFVVNGQPPGVKMDASPFIREGRTFVPVRFLGNALGLDDGRITWDGPTQTATLRGNATLQMTVGKAQVVSDGTAKDIDVAPVLQSDRTFLPARYVAEGLGYEVGWDEASQTVVCWPRGEAKPDVTVAVDYLKQVQQPPEQKSEVPPGYRVTSMGYVVPEKTRMDIKDKRQDVNLTLLIYMPHSEEEAKKISPERVVTPEITETQFKQAEEILASKHGREITKAVIDYARQKTTKLEEITWKSFPLPEGGEITVISKWGTPYITIKVWRVR